MSFFIRNATKSDAQAILNLIIELAIFEKEPNAVEINIKDIVNDGFSKKNRFETIVAQEGKKIIGMALFYERYSTWKGKSLHLEDLIVAKEKRGIGAGKALYTHVMNYAYQNGFNRVSWDVLDWNTNAINFYKSTGATIYKEWRVAHMSKENLKNFINESI